MVRSATCISGAFRGLLAVFLSYGPMTAVCWAAEIKLSDETHVSADVVQTDDTSVTFRVPREKIATIDGQPLPPVLVAGVAAPAFAVTDMLGQPQTIGPNTGKVTILHFWVTWCPYCQADAPQVQTLQNQFKDNPAVRVLTVSLDQERAKLDTFVKDRTVTYPVIVATEQTAPPTNVDLPALYQIQGFPVTYIIDQQGVIRHKLTGSFVKANTDVAKLVEALLPPAQPSPSAQPTSVH